MAAAVGLVGKTGRVEPWDCNHDESASAPGQWVGQEAGQELGKPQVEERMASPPDKKNKTCTNINFEEKPTLGLKLGCSHPQLHVLC